MTFTIELEQEDDGRWLAEVPALPGVLCYGADRGEAVAKVQASRTARNWQSAFDFAPAPDGASLVQDAQRQQSAALAGGMLRLTGVGFITLSTTNRDELARFHGRQHRQTLWHQRTQFLRSIRARHGHDHANARRSQVLLK